MRKFALGLSLFCALSMAACSCGLEKQSLDKLEGNMKVIQTDHKALMTKTNRPAAEVTDWDKQYEAIFTLIHSLQKAAGE